MPTHTFFLLGDFIALNDLLKAEGLCGSGGEAKQRIAEGLVQVDGQVELRKTCKIRAGQSVTFAGHTLMVQAESVSNIL